MKKIILIMMMMITALCGYCQYTPYLPDVVEKAITIDSLHYNTILNKDITVDVYFNDIEATLSYIKDKHPEKLDDMKELYLNYIKQCIIATCMDSIVAQEANYYYIRKLTIYDANKTKILSVKASDLITVKDNAKDIESLIAILRKTGNYIKYE